MKYNSEELYNLCKEPLEAIENKRASLLRKKIIQTVGFSIPLAIILAACVGFDAGEETLMNPLTITMLPIASLFIMGTYFFNSKCKARKKLSAEYKNNVVSKMLENILENGEFHHDKGISFEYFNESLLTSKIPDSYTSEDLVEGTVGETQFKFSEIHAQEKYIGSDGKQKWRDLFKGFFFVADFNKNFNGTTLIERDRFIKSTSRKKMDRVKLEDPAFEKLFDVYGTDQTEARYLLSPALMERFVALNNKISHKITIAFQKSCVNIAIPQKCNNFEVPLFTSMLNIEKIQHEFALIIMLVEIVEDLNLNTRIWSKDSNQSTETFSSTTVN